MLLYYYYLGILMRNPILDFYRRNERETWTRSKIEMLVLFTNIFIFHSENLLVDQAKIIIFFLNYLSYYKSLYYKVTC